MGVLGQIKRSGKKALAGSLYRAGVLNVVRRRTMKGSAAVLLYHRIVDGPTELDDYSPSGMTVRADRFDAQMAYLKRHYDVVKLSEIAEELLEFIGDAPLVIHNARFDIGFLNAELERLGRMALDGGRAVDTVLLARQKFPGAQVSLDALCRRFEIDNSARTKHGALLDAELLAQVYVELTGGRQIGLELAAEIGGAAIEVIALRPRQREFRAPRPHSASVEELARHKAFLESLDSPLWAH